MRRCHSTMSPISRMSRARAIRCLQRRLRMLVAALPSDARAVVVLRYQEDMDPTDIAEILEMSINTVKSHLRRSMAALREGLGNEPLAITGAGSGDSL